MTDENQKHKEPESPQRQDEESSLGSVPGDVEDIDETLKSVGIPSDDDGPRELNSDEVLSEADKHQD